MPDEICFTSTTPDTARAAVSSTDATLPPNRDGRATSTVSIPGSRMSIVNWAVPLALIALSSRWTPPSRPINRNAEGCFSGGSSGTGSRAAASANSPNRPCRSEAWRRTPCSTVISAAGTAHACAAACTSMTRAAAPALRICS